MRAIRRFMAIFGFGVMAAAVLFAALHYHFVFTNDGICLQRKSELGLENTLVNARGWGPLDYAANPRLGWLVLKCKAKN
jgi:hypothetical protein